jgi:hypothetical protein
MSVENVPPVPVRACAVGAAASHFSWMVAVAVPATTSRPFNTTHSNALAWPCRHSPGVAMARFLFEGGTSFVFAA